jgi:hypothetical protein
VQVCIFWHKSHTPIPVLIHIGWSTVSSDNPGYQARNISSLSAIKEKMHYAFIKVTEAAMMIALPNSFLEGCLLLILHSDS